MSNAVIANVLLDVLANNRRIDFMDMLMHHVRPYVFKPFLLGDEPIHGLKPYLVGSMARKGARARSIYRLPSIVLPTFDYDVVNQRDSAYTRQVVSVCWKVISYLKSQGFGDQYETVIIDYRKNRYVLISIEPEFASEIIKAIGGSPSTNVVSRRIFNHTSKKEE